MTMTETVGAIQESSSNAPRRVQNSESAFLHDDRTVFIADGKPARAMEATPEILERVIKFVKSFPLSVNSMLREEELLEHFLSPTLVGIEVGNAIVMFENIIPNYKAHLGFVFWDRKVAGNEKMLSEVCVNMMEILQLHKLYCRIVEKNRVMWRIMERIGFQREACLRDEAILPSGEFCNMLVYGALKGEIK